MLILDMFGFKKNTKILCKRNVLACVFSRQIQLYRNVALFKATNKMQFHTLLPKQLQVKNP